MTKQNPCSFDRRRGCCVPCMTDCRGPEEDRNDGSTHASQRPTCTMSVGPCDFSLMASSDIIVSSVCNHFSKTEQALISKFIKDPPLTSPGAHPLTPKIQSPDPHGLTKSTQSPTPANFQITLPGDNYNFRTHTSTTSDHISSIGYGVAVTSLTLTS